MIPEIFIDMLLMVVGFILGVIWTMAINEKREIEENKQ